jgi:hypothetical protein
MTYFASREVEENVARYVDSYRAIPSDMEPHDCKKRGCGYVIKAEETAAYVGTDLIPGALSARAGLGKLPIGKRAGAVGGEGRGAQRALDRLRIMRAEFGAAERVMVFPS